MKLNIVDNLEIAPDDGINYLVESSVGSFRIASGASSGTLSLSANAWRKDGDNARTAYSCHYALYTRTGTTYSRKAYSSSKSTSWASGSITIASTVEEIIIVISDSVMSANSFASALPTSILAKTSVAVSKDGKNGENGKDAQYIYLRGVNFWHHQSGIYRMVNISGGANLISATIGIGLTIINRATLAHVESVIYNTYSYDSEKTALINKLDTLDDSVFVCLTSGDAISFSDDLIAKLKTFGLASFEYTTTQSNARTPFAFIGYRGLPEGSGITRIYPSAETSPVAEISVYVANGVFSSMDGRSAVRLALDNQHEDFLYSDSNSNAPIAPSGGATSAIHLYDGDADIPLGQVGLSIDYSSGKTSGVPASGQANAPSISNGILTVPHITADAAKVVIKAKYPNNDNGKFYYADFTGNRVRQDKYDLILRPNALAYNPSNYASAAAGDTIQTITPSAERTDLKGNKTTGLTIQTSAVDGLRLYYSYVKTDGTLQAPSLNLLTAATFGVTKSAAGTYIGIYFELRLYSGTGYRMCDYETVEIAKSADGTGLNAATAYASPDKISIPCNSGGGVKAETTISVWFYLSVGDNAATVTSVTSGTKPTGVTVTGVADNAVTITVKTTATASGLAAGVTFTVNGTYGGKSYSAKITVALIGAVQGIQGQSITGETGKMCYICGEYRSDITYVSDSKQTVAVEITGSGNTVELFVLKASTNVVNGIHYPPLDSNGNLNSTYWDRGLNVYNLMRTKYLFANFASLGSFVVSGDWVYSQKGDVIKVRSLAIVTSYNSSSRTYLKTFTPKSVGNHNFTFTASVSSGTLYVDIYDNSEGSSVWSGSLTASVKTVATGNLSLRSDHVYSIRAYKSSSSATDKVSITMTTPADYLYFVGTDPRGESEMNFAPSLALDGLAGKTYQNSGEFQGIVKARLFYSPTGVATNGLVIDPESNACNFYMIEGTDSHESVYLPDPDDYDGLEISFLGIRGGTRSVWYGITLKVYGDASTDKRICGLYQEQGGYPYHHDFNAIYLGYGLVRLKAIDGIWYVLEGTFTPTT